MYMTLNDEKEAKVYIKTGYIIGDREPDHFHVLFEGIHEVTECIVEDGLVLIEMPDGELFLADADEVEIL